MPVLYHGMQAKVLYDFDGVNENGELTIREGQVVTVLNQVSPFRHSQRHPLLAHSTQRVLLLPVGMWAARCRLVVAVPTFARAKRWGGTHKECVSFTGLST